MAYQKISRYPNRHQTKPIGLVIEILLENFLINHGVPERIRTSDLPLRRGLRYPSVPPGLVELIGLLRNRFQVKDTANVAELQKNGGLDCKVGTESRSRTDTVSPPPDFESGASTSSAIPATIQKRG